MTFYELAKKYIEEIDEFDEDSLIKSFEIFHGKTHNLVCPIGWHSRDCEFLDMTFQNPKLVSNSEN